MKHRHNYKQTGTVMVGTGQFWVNKIGTGNTEQMRIPLTNIDNPVMEIKEECLVFICDGCGDVLTKPIRNMGGCDSSPDLKGQSLRQ